MSTVAQILKSKPDHAIYSVPPATKVFEAVKLMADKNIGAVLVMEGERILGILTERDYARKIAVEGRSSHDTPVADIMTGRLVCVLPAQTGEECMALMTENRVRHLPVLDNGKLVGIVSIGDLVKDVIAEQKFVIEQLEHYITGERTL
ncbi:MAG: CBS domain-containing protein [Burkholderiales bacterium]|nr:CBS domain-containing protein [Burkholderiales bacterium]